MQVPGVATAFLDSLNSAKKVHAFSVWAYVVMPDHVHLLVWPKREHYSISTIVKSIKQRSSKAALPLIRTYDQQLADSLVVHWPTGRVENRFWQQGGGYDRNLCDPDAIRNSINYIHANPARKNLAAIEEYAHSSFRAYQFNEESPFAIDPWPGW